MRFSTDRNCSGGPFVGSRLGESGGSLTAPDVIVSAVGAAFIPSLGQRPPGVVESGNDQRRKRDSLSARVRSRFAACRNRATATENNSVVFR
jgi:hypothetical protein